MNNIYLHKQAPTNLQSSPNFLKLKKLKPQIFNPYFDEVSSRKKREGGGGVRDGLFLLLLVEKESSVSEREEERKRRRVRKESG